MTDLKDTLAALSEAATQGEWQAQQTDTDGPDYGVGIVADNLGGLVGAALPWPTEIDSSDFSRVEANASFIVALVNAYRSGQLVPVPSVDAVEQCVMVCPQCEGEGGYPDGLDDAACHMDCTRCGSNGWIMDATAVIAAMKGEGRGDG